jgi:hypothetical protein
MSESDSAGVWLAATTRARYSEPCSVGRMCDPAIFLLGPMSGGAARGSIERIVGVAGNIPGGGAPDGRHGAVPREATVGSVSCLKGASATHVGGEPVIDDGSCTARSSGRAMDGGIDPHH